MRQRAEQGLVQLLVARRPLKVSTKAFWIGLPGAM